MHQDKENVIKYFLKIRFRMKQYKLMKMEDAPGELKKLENKNLEIREGLEVMMEQYPQFAGSIRKISNSLVKISI